MSTDLVQIQQPGEIAAYTPPPSVFETAEGGLFSLRPAKLQLMQKTSRAEGAQEGKFRESDTGEHYDVLHLVMLENPAEKRTMYRDRESFGESPMCFSTDGKKPHANAQFPQAMSCAGCKHSNWDLWKKNGKRREDIPKCSNRYEPLVVDRVTQIPYELVVSGKSISPFLDLTKAIAKGAAKYKVVKGVWPQLFDFSFKVKANRKVDTKGIYFEMQFTDLGMIREDDRAQFGELFRQFAEAKRNGVIRDEADREDEGVTEAMGEEGNGQTIDAQPYTPPQTTSNEEVTI